jgi:Leucine Rich repeat
MSTKLDFWTPVTYQKPTLLGTVDGYFNYHRQGQVAVVIPDVMEDKSRGVYMEEHQANLFLTILKVISYATLIIPALMLVAKCALRTMYAFHVHTPVLPDEEEMIPLQKPHKKEKWIQQPAKVEPNLAEEEMIPLQQPAKIELNPPDNHLIKKKELLAILFKKNEKGKLPIFEVNQKNLLKVLHWADETDFPIGKRTAHALFAQWAGKGEKETLQRLLDLQTDGTLDLSDSDITDEDLTWMIPYYQNKGEEIISLNLRECKHITDACLQQLSALPSLRYLDLNLCHQITDAGLEYVSTIPSLTTLVLNKCYQITDKGIQSLTALPSLSELYLANCNKITDAGLQYLSTMHSLTKLVLCDCTEITDKGLQYLATLPDLAKLYLWNCSKITDAGVKHLSARPSLTHLELARCDQITDACLPYIAALPALIELDLRHCDKMTNPERQGAIIPISNHLRKSSPFNLRTSKNYDYSNLHNLVLQYL